MRLWRIFRINNYLWNFGVLGFLVLGLHEGSTKFLALLTVRDLALGHDGDGGRAGADDGRVGGQGALEVANVVDDALDHLELGALAVLGHERHEVLQLGQVGLDLGRVAAEAELGRPRRHLLLGDLLRRRGELSAGRRGRKVAVKIHLERELGDWHLDTGSNFEGT